ncbi:PREDICTED: uncharacterized protein LOC108558487 [Nicrophorus vespilloides]|uniref:Uncharacterized protein LOC108558487 n=1 Tax=Nicrophorus vespilloides TaxID=110193 RepID=A0ABM1M8J3_NICVS|nr:PREDICTED: uncharacterized protein LOC108558487 [Nicrophorus vespilloides]
MGVEKNEYPKASGYLYYGALLSYIAFFLLLIAFCSPYWVQSFENTVNEFLNMGLWEYCFDNFRYPHYQFDKLFTGCHHVFSQEYYVIREWLVPSWLMSVQAFVTISFLLSATAQVLQALQLCRWPLNFVLRYEYILSGIDFICNSLSAIFMFLAVLIFGTSHARRDWLLYPNYNYLSWSYGVAILSFFFHMFAAMVLWKEAKQSYELRRESKNLIMQMQHHQHQPHHTHW